MEHQKVNIYQRDGFYLFCWSSKTSAGVWQDYVPGFGISTSEPPGAFGQTLLSALYWSGQKLPDSKDWKGYRFPLLTFTGVTERRGYSSADITRVSVVLRGDKLQVESWRYDGNGFKRSAISPIEIELDSSIGPDELERAVIPLFQAQP